MRILIAEDDKNLREGLSDLLHLEGHTCITAPNGEIAWAIYQAQSPDFCLFDVMMPVMDGYELSRKIRAINERMPILLLTARNEEIDRVLGLEIGADDYMAKPFSTRELLARIATISRRCQLASSSNRNFIMEDLDIDPDALRAKRQDHAIDLTEREVKILYSLYKRAGLVVSKNELFDLCWGRDYMPNSRSLDQQISVLRHKIEQDPSRPSIVKTVHGAGYRFDPS